MKRVLYICLVLLVLGGFGVGLWFMKEGERTLEAPLEQESASAQVSDRLVSDAFQELESTTHLSGYFTSVPALTQTQTATQVVLFAPTKAAVETFVKDTALGVEKYLPYHVVVAETAIEVLDGKKLKTVDGQELVIVSVDGDLYVRDAKGSDARLRKPISAKNGVIYVIDKVLLTQ